MVTSRIYGMASIIAGDRGDPESSARPLDLEKLHEIDIYFNVLDPLNTAGSPLVLEQEPNSPDFQKARAVRVGNVTYHPSRLLVMMNERPLYVRSTIRRSDSSGRWVLSGRSTR